MFTRGKARKPAKSKGKFSFLKIGACLCASSLLFACAGTAHGNGSSSGVPPTSAQNQPGSSGAAAASGVSEYAFPPETAIQDPPVYKKPEELPGPELTPLESTLNEGPLKDMERDEDSGLFIRNIWYIPLDATDYIEIPSPILTSGLHGARAFVAGEHFVAATWGADTLCFAVSRNNGGTWETTEIDSIPFRRTSKTICFSNEQLGWITVQTETDGQTLLYQTADGGKSWERISYFRETTPINCFFATENIGWLRGVLVPGSKVTYPLLETVNGGKSWYPVRLTTLSAPAGGGEIEVEQTPLYSPLIGWVLEYSEHWSQESIYFSAAGENTMWEPAESRLELPAGTTHEDFRSKISFLFPKEYNWQNGLKPEEASSFWLACFTISFIIANYGENALIAQPMYAYVPTAAQINEYVYYQYNDAHFDATKLDEYDDELGGIQHGDAGHGWLGMNTCLRIVNLLPNGDMELYFDVIPSVLGVHTFTASGTFYAHIRPTGTPNGDVIYTLLESKPLTPLPAIQPLHFAV